MTRLKTPLSPEQMQALVQRAHAERAIAMRQAFQRVWALASSPFQRLVRRPTSSGRSGHLAGAKA